MGVNAEPWSLASGDMLAIDFSNCAEHSTLLRWLSNSRRLLASKYSPLELKRLNSLKENKKIIVVKS
jgi:hypothetical protein